MRFKIPDIKNALSVAKAANRDINFALKLRINDESSSTIVRNIYESFRMLGDALLIKKGIKSQDHLEPLRELMKIKISTPRSINVLENIRILRHNINYYGYQPNINEVKDVVSFAKNCFQIIYEEILKQINEN